MCDPDSFVTGDDVLATTPLSTLDLLFGDGSNHGTSPLKMSQIKKDSTGA